MNDAVVAPTIEYGTLAPMLLVFGAAVVGVLVEAFAPRYLRKSIHVPVTLLSLAVLGLLQTILASRPAIALGLAAAPLLYVVWANSRFTLRAALGPVPGPAQKA